MTVPLFLTDPYAQEAKARLARITDEGGLVLDASLFYPEGGGQPGDSGWLRWPGGGVEVATSLKGPRDEIVLVPAAPVALPEPGTEILQRLDWPRRHRHMRMHSALHLLSVVIPLPVTGGQVGAAKGRLDFDMPEPLEDRDAIEAELNALIDRDLTITEAWITQADLDANPGLIKTLSVRPPRGVERVRLIAIGSGAETVDLQPCGGTHVARTSEIGHVRLGKIEKKSRTGRRVNLLFDD